MVYTDWQGIHAKNIELVGIPALCSGECGHEENLRSYLTVVSVLALRIKKYI